MNVLEIEYNVQGKMEHNHVKSDEAKFDGCNVKQAMSPNPMLSITVDDQLSVSRDEIPCKQLEDWSFLALTS